MSQLGKHSCCLLGLAILPEAELFYRKASVSEDDVIQRLEDCHDFVFLSGPVCALRGAACLDTAQLREIPRDTSSLRRISLGAKTVVMEAYMLPRFL